MAEDEAAVGGGEPLGPDGSAIDPDEDLADSRFDDLSPIDRAEETNRWERASRTVGLAVAGFLSLFVFALLNYPDPDGWGDLAEPLLFLDTTPSGGDMGAHVWGPAFLRDNLLTKGQLAGWTPDWYAGFPAYHFYMVVPSLAIVAVNAGLPWFLGLPVAGAIIYGGQQLSRRSRTGRRWIMAAAWFLAVCAVSLPYGVSFKLLSVAGLVMFPMAGWAMARLARAPEPVPAFTAIASFIFLFDTNFSIYGGNIASTLAGEFAFSLSLCLSLLAIGMTVRGLDDQRWRAPAAVVIALGALCHIIPVFFLVPALVLAVLMHPEVPRAWAGAGVVAIAMIPIAFADGTGLGVRGLAVVAVIVVIASASVAEPKIFNRSLWLAFVGFTAMLLSAFWLLPFYLREDFFNDMGWERLNAIGEPLLTVPIKVALPMAAVGAVMAFALRERVGMIFTGTGLLFLAAVANLGEGPLWNARLLPFYYLSVYMLAAIGVAMVVRHLASILSGDLERPDGAAVVAGSWVALAATLIAVALPLRIMPGGGPSDRGDGSYQWLVFTNQARSFLPGWIDWNYSGYERKPAYGEYSSVVASMDSIGRSEGCGRAMWEYEKGLDRYGTPMALMLLPHWTDGCIGSMEGLYFESSASTPFHFLNQSMLSEAPSRAQRDLPYQDFDINRGVAQLQVTGVRYYMAQSDEAIDAARSHPDLIEVQEAPPFVVFEVLGSELVEGLSVEPIVAQGRTAEELAGEFGDEAEIDRFEVGWVSQAVEFYNDPDRFAAMPAEDGPETWVRSQALSPEAGVQVEPAVVTAIDTTETDRISFTVDRVGAPVMVKASYFPNWKVDGADGPWRIGPNLMVVVPTDNDVELTYQRTSIELGSIALTVIGLFGLGLLGGIDRRRWLIFDGLGIGHDSNSNSDYDSEIDRRNDDPGERGLVEYEPVEFNNGDEADLADRDEIGELAAPGEPAVEAPAGDVDGVTHDQT